MAHHSKTRSKKKRMIFAFAREAIFIVHLLNDIG
jgi:hypothetical protein